jgi:hypothetical protein
LKENVPAEGKMWRILLLYESLQLSARLISGRFLEGKNYSAHPTACGKKEGMAARREMKPVLRTRRFVRIRSLYKLSAIVLQKVTCIY